MKNKIATILTILLVVLSALPASALAPGPGGGGGDVKKDIFGGKIPLSLFVPFGGKITSVSLHFCLIPAVIIVIPYPFLVIKNGPPKPAKTYFLWGIPKTPLQPSKLFATFTPIPTAWSLGTYMPKLDAVFRLVCVNRAFLPKADGVIRYIGTSLPTGKGNLEIEAVTAAEAGLPQPVFDPKAPEYADFCAPESKIGECLPKN